MSDSTCEKSGLTVRSIALSAFGVYLTSTPTCGLTRSSTSGDAERRRGCASGAGAHVRRGDEVAAGRQLLEPGQRVRAADEAVAAARQRAPRRTGSGDRADSCGTAGCPTSADRRSCSAATRTGCASRASSPWSVIFVADSQKKSGDESSPDASSVIESYWMLRGVTTKKVPVRPVLRGVEDDAAVVVEAVADVVAVGERRADRLRGPDRRTRRRRRRNDRRRSGSRRSAIRN